MTALCMQQTTSMRWRLLSTVAFLLLAGCSTAASRMAHEPVAASTTEAGVEVVATTRAWRGWPKDLSRFVTPVHLRLVNRGSVPLRVGYQDFALVPPTGQPLAAVLPQEVRGVTFEPPPAGLPSAGFALGAQGYAGESDWVMPGQTLWTSAYPVGRVGEQFALPTPDILIGALREGVLAPGAGISGFVYFERLPPHTESAELTTRLIDASSGEPVGRAVIPLTLP